MFLRILSVSLLASITGCMTADQNQYHAEIDTIFDKSIQYIEIVPHTSQISPIRISEKEKVMQIKKWLMSAKYSKAPFASYPDTLDNLIIKYSDAGEKDIQMKISSPTYDYIIVKFRNHVVHANSFPRIAEIETWKNILHEMHENALIPQSK